MSRSLAEMSKSLTGVQSYCMRAFAEALEVRSALRRVTGAELRKQSFWSSLVCAQSRPQLRESMCVCVLCVVCCVSNTRLCAVCAQIIPLTLAENAGLHPIAIVTELRNKHALGETSAGINVKKGVISNMVTENVVQVNRPK